MSKERSCPKCKRITVEKVCLACKAATKEGWSGFVGIVDKDNSLIAKKLNVEENGKFAVRM